MGKTIVIALLLSVIAGIGVSTAVDSNTRTISDKEVVNYPVNEQGQTYGQGPYPPGPSKEPDLIKAVGENGVVGYVKSSDLDPKVNSPEEAVAYQKSKEGQGGITIPLYEADGKTVIGTFKVGN
ncbi:hypothetical protein J31TS4_03020 [Paenibacillus sp. J31TS4]|uniref:hypothetical protein n=1 Tax=Paenibacillus sp. J31TS4 TaxID=2807195 RepID=UPI001B145D1D|nr:hypothetical protein [Paenibacillus sp. J31TS4]GIP37022.1 hypothetical protein J31TS4_03020 [Paenibacillus sp. J31TS4]